MSVLNQKTIKEPINIKGVGLHTGAMVNMRICPGEPNTGIVFNVCSFKNYSGVWSSWFDFHMNIFTAMQSNAIYCYSFFKCFLI